MINIIMQFRHQNCDYLIGYYNQQTEISFCHHGLTLVGAPELPLRSYSTHVECINTVPSATPPEDTSNNITIDLRLLDETCSSDPTKMKDHSQVIGMEDAGSKVYGKVTGLHNKRCKYLELWNLCHPSWSVYNIQWAHLFSLQLKTWIHLHLQDGLDNFKIKSLQSAPNQCKLFSEVESGLSDGCSSEDDLLNLGTLYCRDIVICLKFPLHISRSRCTSVLNQFTMQIRSDSHHTAKRIQASRDDIHSIC